MSITYLTNFLKTRVGEVHFLKHPHGFISGQLLISPRQPRAGSDHASRGVYFEIRSPGSRVSFFVDQIKEYDPKYQTILLQ